MKSSPKATRSDAEFGAELTPLGEYIPASKSHDPRITPPPKSIPDEIRKNLEKL